MLAENYKEIWQSFKISLKTSINLFCIWWPMALYLYLKIHTRTSANVKDSLLTPHSQQFQDLQKKKDQSYLVPISSCRFLSELNWWSSHWAQNGTLMWKTKTKKAHYCCKAIIIFRQVKRNGQLLLSKYLGLQCLLYRIHCYNTVAKIARCAPT